MLIAAILFIFLSCIASFTMSLKPSSIKLTYFDIQGAAEPTRLALTLSGTPFEDVRVNFEQWTSMKPQTPYGQLPLLNIDGGETRTQSMAMLRYVGATYSETLYPRDKLFDVEEAIGLVEDMRNSWLPCIYVSMRPESYGYPEGFGQTEEGKALVKSMRTGWLENKLPHFAQYISEMIKRNGGVWMASKDEPTIADCFAYCQLIAFTRGYMDHVPTDSLDKYPVIKAYLERFNNISAIKNWYSKH